MLPTFIVHEALRAGALVALLPGYRWLSAGLYAVYPRSTHLPRRVRVLVDHLAQSFGGDLPHWDRNLPGA